LASLDTDPVDVFFLSKLSRVAGARVASDVVSMRGISVAVAVTVSQGAGNPRVKINDGAEVVSGEVSVGDTVQVVLDAPVVAGERNSAVLDLGDDTVSFSVGFADPTRDARAFVTSSTFTSNLGGLDGADAKCAAAANAAGLGGAFAALLSTSRINVNDRAPYNWTRVVLVDGAVVATDWEQLWRGPLLRGIDLDETGASQLGQNVFTGSTVPGVNYHEGYDAGGWQDLPATVCFGSSGSISGDWLNISTTWGYIPMRLYCLER
jgi:hypothetical protein